MSEVSNLVYVDRYFCNLYALAPNSFGIKIVYILYTTIFCIRFLVVELSSIPINRA